ncbi:hypothetical protein [Fulvivirga ligni]|uniref:hypothetical protein n=1 Tax=Fulvivirga ligni TaxID=2904246 RepID=UPI001F4753AC|nr:hypothetical protein [Fulvivirga ligni]UII24312.1 hypothetical protein LVD16_13905 [Fulvivirga ligni]
MSGNKIFTSLLILLLIFQLTGCKVSGDPEPQIDCSQSGLKVELLELANVSGCDKEDGSITVQGSGGEGQLTFNINGGSFQGDPSFDNLKAATYSIIVQDENGCTASSFFTVKTDGASVAISEVQVAEAGCGSAEGNLSIIATGNGEVMYKLGNGAFQASPDFTGLTSGNYEVTVKDETGCTTSQQAYVNSGISYDDEVKAIITANCFGSGCHDGGTGSSTNWTNFQNVQNHAAQIKSRTQSGSMPPNGSLSQDEKDKIACWVNDGALDN